MIRSSKSPMTGIQSGMMSIGEIKRATMAKRTFLSLEGMRSSLAVSVKKLLSLLKNIFMRPRIAPAFLFGYFWPLS